MAFAALVGGINGELNTAAYQYGFFNDTVLVVDGNSFSYSIRTYEGNDLINNARTTTTGASLTTSYAGSGNDTIIGGNSIDIVYDGSGNDTVRAGGGNDSVSVGAGNDVYDGGSGFDTLLFNLNSYDGLGGQSFNITAVVVDLAKTTAQNFGKFGSDTLRSIEGVAGGGGSDILLGSNGNNTLLGGNGRDQLTGRGGADKLDLGAGLNDEAVASRDTVKYLSISDSGRTTSTWDVIYNFDKGTASTDDRIYLSAIDATPTVSGNQAFLWRGTASFTSSASGEVRLVVSGADTLVYVDSDADSAAEMIIKVQGVTGLAKTDFIL